MRERRAPEVVFPLLAALWCLIFFSASGSKRVGYVLPAFAPLALVIGVQVDRLLTLRNTWLRPLPAVAMLVGAVGAVALAAFEYSSVAVAAAIGIVMLVGMGLVVARRRRLAPAAAFALAIVVVLAESLAGVGWVLPQYAERFSLRREVVQMRAEAAGGPVVCFPRGWDSVSFYLGRDDVLVFTEEQRDRAVEFVRAHPDALIFVRDGEAGRQLLSELGPLEFEERGRQGGTIAGRLRLAARDGWAYNGSTP